MISGDVRAAAPARDRIGPSAARGRPAGSSAATGPPPRHRPQRGTGSARDSWCRARAVRGSAAAAAMASPGRRVAGVTAQIEAKISRQASSSSDIAAPGRPRGRGLEAGGGGTAGEARTPSRRTASAGQAEPFPRRTISMGGTDMCPDAALGAARQRHAACLDALKRRQAGSRKQMEQFLRSQTEAVQTLRQAKLDSGGSGASTPTSGMRRGLTESSLALAMPDQLSRKSSWAQLHEGDSMFVAMSGLAELQHEMAQEVSELRRAVVVQASQMQRLAAVAEVPEGVCRGRVRFLAAFLLGLTVPWLAGVWSGRGGLRLRTRTRSDGSGYKDDGDGAAPVAATSTRIATRIRRRRRRRRNGTSINLGRILRGVLGSAPDPPGRRPATPPLACSARQEICRHLQSLMFVSFLAPRKWAFKAQLGAAHASLARTKMPCPVALIRSAFLRGPGGRRRAAATDPGCGRAA
ncbi:unnamed protein product [Prorocentrum cordatum]|uniref:Uncharacterized protein n=1 Tax=Prorocentrum cordatum TaxID=2364126 RepID=A0ABN9TKA8_9DINO|nr:unnamed protein product [Polarella glacialis]